MACLLTAPPAQATHPRPKSASPVHMSLVPAYAACAAPNRTHGPPLAFASCNPPAQTSAQATVGTPDANGGAANGTGHLRLKTLPCDFNCFDGDFVIDIGFDDVRCVPTGARCGAANASGPADYSGEVRFSFAVRFRTSGTLLLRAGDRTRRPSRVSISIKCWRVVGARLRGHVRRAHRTPPARLQPAYVPDGGLPRLGEEQKTHDLGAG